MGTVRDQVRVGQVEDPTRELRRQVAILSKMVRVARDCVIKIANDPRGSRWGRTDAVRTQAILEDLRATLESPGDRGGDEHGR